jgi:1-acyl-sn-glycerol-3-phosphate acyltransferase
MVRHLRQGRTLIIACEGKRFDALGPFRRGAAWAALRTGALVVPCSLHGVQSLFRKMPWPNKLWGDVEIHVHPPLDPRAFGTVDELTEAIRCAIASQIDYPLLENVGASNDGRPSPSNTLPV